MFALRCPTRRLSLALLAGITVGCGDDGASGPTEAGGGTQASDGGDEPPTSGGDPSGSAGTEGTGGTGESGETGGATGGPGSTSQGSSGPTGGSNSGADSDGTSSTGGAETSSGTEGTGSVGDPVEDAYDTIDAADVFAHIEYLASDALEGRDPQRAGGQTAADYVAGVFERSSLEPFGDGGTFFQAVNGLSPNVVAVRPGTGEGFLVFTGHYDHLGQGGGGADRIYNGADDNASGTAVVLELGEAFGGLEADLEYTLVFIAFTGEESGLIGSRYWIDNAPVPLDEIRGVLNMDMVSRNEEDLIFVEQSAEFPVLGEAIRAANRVVGMRVRHDEHPEWRGQSDHAAFLEANVPALYLGVEDHPDYHQVSDESDKVLPALTADVARLGFQWAISLDGTQDTLRGRQPPALELGAPLRHPDRHHHGCRPRTGP